MTLVERQWRCKAVPMPFEGEASSSFDFLLGRKLEKGEPLTVQAAVFLQPALRLIDLVPQLETARVEQALAFTEFAEIKLLWLLSAPGDMRWLAVSRPMLKVAQANWQAIKPGLAAFKDLRG